MPPLALHARDIGAEVDVLVELALRRRAARTCRYLAAEAEVGHLAHATVGAPQDVGHALDPTVATGPRAARSAPRVRAVGHGVQVAGGEALVAERVQQARLLAGED